MHINDFDGDPWSEAQHIYEVMQRGNPVKGLTIDGGIIQIEQTSRANAEIVLNYFIDKGYRVSSPLQKVGSGYVAGISKIRSRSGPLYNFER